MSISRMELDEEIDAIEPDKPAPGSPYFGLGGTEVDEVEYLRQLGLVYALNTNISRLDKILDRLCFLAREGK